MDIEFLKKRIIYDVVIVVKADANIVRMDMIKKQIASKKVTKFNFLFQNKK
jgi:hypothetical protein